MLAEIRRVLRPGGRSRRERAPRLARAAVLAPLRSLPRGARRATSASSMGRPWRRIDHRRRGWQALRRAPRRHALHVPYWWLRCAVRGVTRPTERWPLVRCWHRLLVWDLMSSAPRDPDPGAAAGPAPRQERGASTSTSREGPSPEMRTARAPGQSRPRDPPDRTRGLYRRPILAPHRGLHRAAHQHSDGAVAWFEGGHVDPWDHVEAAMGLSIGGATRPRPRAAYRVAAPGASARTAAGSRPTGTARSRTARAARRTSSPTSPPASGTTT
jgi:hypothetical protein